MYTIEDEQELEWLEWSSNGQMLAVSSSNGSLDVFLVKLPNVSCSHQTKIAFLSSLREITFFDIMQEKLDKDSSNSRNRIQLDIEPTLISICNNYLAACMNNKAYFYELNTYSSNFEIIKEKEDYRSIIKCMFMNDQYAAILFTDNRAILERILDDQYSEDLNEHANGQDKKQSSYFQVDTKLSIVCIELTSNFFIWCTDTGIIELFSVEDWTIVYIYSHLTPIKQICSDFLGLRILLVDERNEAFVFDATNEQATPIEIRKKEEDNNVDELDNLSINYEELPTDRIVVGQRNYNQSFPFQFTRLFWDVNDHSMFGVVDRKQILIYYYVSKSVQGSFVQFIGKSNLEDNINAQLICDGFIYYQTSTGHMSFSQLDTHNYSKVLSRSKNSDKNSSSSNQESVFHNLLKLRRISDCWLMCRTINKIEFWLQFVDCCLHDLNIDEAIRVSRYIGHAGLVWSLKSIEQIEEWNLLAGHLAMYLQWFDLAEKLYLKSTQPTCALKLRLDLMQWDISLLLAKRLANDQLPFIHKVKFNLLL